MCGWVSGLLGRGYGSFVVVVMASPMQPDFLKQLEGLINKYSLEGSSNTPDFILARYLGACLEAWNEGLRLREAWYGRGVMGDVSNMGTLQRESRPLPTGPDDNEGSPSPGLGGTGIDLRPDPSIHDWTLK